MDRKLQNAIISEVNMALGIDSCEISADEDGNVIIITNSSEADLTETLLDSDIEIDETEDGE